MKWLGISSYREFLATPSDLIDEAIVWLNEIEEERIHEELRNL